MEVIVFALAKERGVSMKFFPIFILSTTLLIMGCSGGSSKPGGTPPPTDPNKPVDPDHKNTLNCDQVVTEEKVVHFNQSQTRFHIKSSGYDVNCKSETNVNGKVERVEANGHSSISILPNLQWISVQSSADAKYFFVTAKVLEPTDDDIKSILSQLKIPLGDQPPRSFVTNMDSSPSYLRFGKGDIFYIDNFNMTKGEQEAKADFKIQAETSEELEILKTKVSKFQSGAVSMELLWYPKNDQFSSVQLTQEIPVWASLEAASIIKSLVRETELSNKYTVYNEAFNHIYYWTLNAQKVHALVPELYQYALSEWQSPNISDNNASSLVNKLRYIVAVDSQSDKKLILDTYNSVSKYHSNLTESLDFSFKYASGKNYTKQQLDLALEASEVLSPALRSRSWKLTLSILSNTNFDRGVTLFAAQAGLLMSQNELASFDNEDAYPIFAKINAGLNSNNMNLYFSTISYFYKKLRASSSEAEKAGDSLVLSGKLNAQNQSLYFDFMAWLKSTAYLDFSDSISVIKNLTQSGPLDVPKVDLFKSVFAWLKGTAYLSRSDASDKSISWTKSISFTEARFALLKSYYSWLTGSIYMNRSDALEKAEEAVITKNTEEEQIKNIMDLAQWYISSIYFNRSDALTKSETLVLVKKLSVGQTQLLKQLVGWLISSIYMNKTDAAEKGEGYLLGPKPLDSDRANLLMDLTGWYIKSFYQNKTDALERAEKLIVKVGYSQDQISALKSAAEWLVSKVYLNRSDAIDKSELYLTKKGLTLDKLSQLQSQFNSYKSQGKDNSDALDLAERKVLP